MNEPILELVNATVLKGDVRALDGLTLTIRSGQHTAILGPNGSGKSTLVNVLTREDYPLASGNGQPPVRIFGQDRWDIFELRSQIGIVSADLHQRFVEGNSMGRVKGEDAVVSGFFATQGFLLYQSVTAAMRQRAVAALEQMESSHLAGKTLNEMSTGEARRVLIARALVAEPRALVLDEPSSGLDIVARDRFLGMLERLATQTTLILVTHHVEEILPSIGRVILLKRGKVAAEGPKRTVLTSEHLGDVFEAAVAVDEIGGRYYARRA